MHPSTRLVVWLLVLVAIQALAGTLLVAALLLLSLSGTAALRRCLQLAWRARWLFVSLSVILAWGGVGDPAWSGPLAPSREGLIEALTQAGLVDVAGHAELERLVVGRVRGVALRVLPQAELDRRGGADRRAHAQGHGTGHLHRPCHVWVYGVGGPLRRRRPRATQVRRSRCKRCT